LQEQQQQHQPARWSYHLGPVIKLQRGKKGLEPNNKSLKAVLQLYRYFLSPPPSFLKLHSNRKREKGGKRVFTSESNWM
jgi:hypothetical protein